LRGRLSPPGVNRADRHHVHRYGHLYHGAHPRRRIRHADHRVVGRRRGGAGGHNQQPRPALRQPALHAPLQRHRSPIACAMDRAARVCRRTPAPTSDPPAPGITRSPSRPPHSCCGRPRQGLLGSRSRSRRPQSGADSVAVAPHQCSASVAWPRSSPPRATWTGDHGQIPSISLAMAIGPGDERTAAHARPAIGRRPVVEPGGRRGPLCSSGARR
jgi:hypothetical protein